jgi:hypothetical protein
MNPCFHDTNYYHYINNYYISKYNLNDSTMNESTTLSIQWDYVVMNDQTVQPGISYRRKRSILSIRRTYSNLLFNHSTTTSKSIIPVLLTTYGYDKSLYGIINNVWMMMTIQTINNRIIIAPVEIIISIIMMIR